MRLPSSQVKKLYKHRPIWRFAEKKAPWRFHWAKRPMAPNRFKPTPPTTSRAKRRTSDAFVESPWKIPKRIRRRFGTWKQLKSKKITKSSSRIPMEISRDESTRLLFRFVGDVRLDWKSRQANMYPVGALHGHLKEDYVQTELRRLREGLRTESSKLRAPAQFVIRRCSRSNSTKNRRFFV